MVGSSGGSSKRISRVIRGVWGLIPIASFFELFFEGVFFRFFATLGGFWEVFGSQNGGQNRFLDGFLAMLFLIAFWHRFGVVFGRVEPLKISIFLRKNNDFHEIDVFEKIAKKARFWLRFWMPKRRKINEK